MANQKRQRQRARKTANPYGSNPAENPYATTPGATQQVPGTSNAGPTPDQAVPGMKDDMGDGTPPGMSNAGRNGQAMANKVALHCFGCGAEGYVGLDKVARIGEDGKQLTCQVCKSTDLDVLDREPVVSARQREAMQRQAIWPGQPQVERVHRLGLHRRRTAQPVSHQGPARGEFGPGIARYTQVGDQPEAAFADPQPGSPGSQVAPGNHAIAPGRQRGSRAGVVFIAVAHRHHPPVRMGIPGNRGYAHGPATDLPP